MQLQASIDACPVDCIHWVDRQQLPALEYVMQKRMGRTNVGVMMAGQGGSTGDVFELTLRFLKEREARWGYYSPWNKVSLSFIMLFACILGVCCKWCKQIKDVRLPRQARSVGCCCRRCWL